MKKVILVLINFYQTYLSFDKGILAFFAPGGACKYTLSCSEYTKQRIKELGIFRGGLLGAKRIWSCR